MLCDTSGPFRPSDRFDCEHLRSLLRKFAAQRGTPTLIVSDNAMTFKASEKLLRRLHDVREVKEHLEGNRMDWRFNLERAPWWGGFFERLISTMKRCLRKVLGNARLACENADVFPAVGFLRRK